MGNTAARKIIKMIKIYIKENAIPADPEFDMLGESYDFSTKAVIKVDDDANADAAASAFYKAMLISGFSEETICKSFYYVASNNAYNSTLDIWNKFATVVKQDLEDVESSLNRQEELDGSNIDNQFSVYFFVCTTYFLPKFVRFYFRGEK